MTLDTKARPWWNTNFTTTTTTPTTPDVCDNAAEMTTMKVLYAFFMSIVLFVSVSGNVAVMVAVIMSPLLKARQTFTFAASLAISDMIMSLSQIPDHIRFIMNDRKFCPSLRVCYVRQYSDYVGNIASILNLFAVSLDRYIAIEHPYKYFDMLTSSRSKIAIFSIWLFSSVWGVTGLFPWCSDHGGVAILNGICRNNNELFLTISFWGIFMPVLAIITSFYVLILRTAFAQIQKIGATNVKSSNEKKGSQLRRELKATKSIAIVYLVFVICWFPAAILVIISVVHPPTIAKMSPNAARGVWWLRDMLTTISMSSNPIIYGFSNSQFRKALKSLYRKHRIQALTDGVLFRNTTRFTRKENNEISCKIRNDSRKDLEMSYPKRRQTIDVQTLI